MGINDLLKRGGAAVAVVVLGVVCCCLAVLMADIPSGRFVGGVEYLPGGGGGGGGAVPAGGACSNANRPYPDNPFIGWPVARFPGDWKTISSWYCDPTYFRGYIHWGIDLAVRVTAEDWDSIDGAEVTCTGDYGWIAAAAGDGGKHNGMGNYVQVRHLVCSQRCGRAGEEAGEKHHITLLERDAAACVEPAPPPDDYGTLVPTPTPSTPDLLLDCIEDDWRAYYFHLRDITVAPGDFVEFGDVLGHIDNTGNSTGPHLHYQINSPTDGAIDPAPAMCPDGYFPGLRAQYRWERGVCP